MPIRQNILRKGKAPKQNLLGFDVLQEETGVLGDLSTSKFFKISEFPSVLPTGNSSFLIEGSDLLKPDIELKTELLDAEGNPIFHYAIPNYDKELPARRITIEVYQDDVINGIGSFTVLGELDPRKVTIPSAFQNTYNVRFSAPISINKNIKNTQPIRFYGDPRLTVSELVKGVIQPVYTGNQRTKTITGSVSLNVTTTTIPTDYGAENSTTADSTQFDDVGGNQAAYISQNAGEAQSSIIGNTNKKTEPRITYVVEEMEKGVDNELNKITSTMQGATLSINRPDLLVDTSVYPDSKFTKPTTFSTKILEVLNSTSFTTNTQYKIKSKTNNQEYIVPLNASSSGTTITHNVGSVVRTASQVFQRSFANMTVGNLRTFSGDTYKAKIYAKEDGSSGEFEKIYETLVESPNELLDQNSNSGFKSVGIFATQSIVDNFWVSSSNTFTATQNDDTLIDGILLSGSTEPNGNSFTFETSQSYSLEKNEPYLVDFNVAFKPQNKVQTDGTTKKDAKLEVFLTGTFLSETSQEVTLGEVDLGEFDFNKVNTFTKVEKRQVSDFLTHNIEGGVATGSLGFRLHSGEFILSDVRLRPFSETNFSPGFFKANVPMPPAIKRGQPYDFVVEFYDANNSLAEAVAVADDVVFAGPRQVLGDGDDGILTGSVFLSNTEDSGIEFHGGSAYIRSIGFNGFERARDEGTAGFMMFSGSVSKSLNTSESYDGVGIEIISGSKGSDLGDKFLQFRTNDGNTPAVFKVQTDDFFLGGEGQFVSGSNGNIELSSSKLHITSDGQITGSEVLFSGGTITSDVNILGSVAANSILTPATIGGVTATPENASSSIDDNGRAIFKSGSIGGFTLTDNEISASGLSLKSSGQITGSNFLLEGGTITSDVVILSSIAANSILTPASRSDGSATTLADASASIDDKGNAVFRSGSIGGFAFTSTVLSASKFELDTANEKLTLGSGNSVFIADSGDGIQLGNATFGSAPFRVNMDGDLTATSVTISGNITATAGPVSQSLTALGIKTGSLDVSSSLASSSLERVKIITGSLIVSSSLASSSLESVKLTTGSLEEASSSLSEASSSLSDASSSLSAASESMQKQFVLVDDDTLNLQNAKGGILSSFSDYAKFFGSASNALVTSSDNGTINYTEINDKGFLVVTGSSTASFFGNVTTIGDTTAQHISIAPDSLSIKTANNKTVLSASAGGIDMSGSITAGSGKIANWDIDGNKLESFNSSTKGIVLDADPSTPNITIQEDSNNKIELFHTTANNFGLKGTIGGDVLFRLGSTNEIGGFSITENAISSSNNKLILKDSGQITASAAKISGDITITSGDLAGIDADSISGSSVGPTADVSASAASAHSASKELRTQIVLDSGGMALKNAASNKTLADYGATTKIFDGENNNTFVEVGGNGIIIVSGSVTGSLFSAETSSFFGTGSNKHDRIEIVGEGLNVYKNNKQVTSIGEDVVVGQQASGQSNVQITSGALNFRNNATTIFSIANDGTVTFNSSDVRTLLSGSLGQHAANIRTLSATTVSGSSISGSKSANTTAEVGISGSTSATATAEVGVSSSAAVTSDMADTRAQLVLDNSSANNQKINLVNTTGGIMSSFGRAVKFFGSASNALVTSSANGTVHYTEINPDGVLLVANSETASLFAANTSSIFGGAGTNPEHERVEVTATGLKVYQNNKQLTNIGANGLDVFDTSNNRVGRFAATTQIGNTSNEHIQISSSGLEIFDGSTRYIGIQGTGMQIGSVANGITLDTSGNATFNGSITINASDLPDGTVSGSAQLADDISGSSTLVSASAASANSSSIALTTQVVLDSGGMALKDQSGNTLADYGTDIQLGVVDSNKRNILIDTDSGVNIRNNTTNIAQFGSDVTLTGGTITINDGTRDRLVIDANDITMTDESGNTAFNLDTNVLTLGEVASNQENIVIDPTNGVRLRTNTTTHAQLTADKFVMGEVGDDKSRVEVESGGVKIINRQSSADSTMIQFKSDGDIESGDFLIERSRLFGAGGDGDIVLKSNDCTVSNGAGSAAKSSTSVIVDERGDQVCIRTGSVWEMKGDWYTKSLEIDNSVAATTLITSGSRLFVQGALTIDSSCIIHNDGGDGDDGADAANSDNSTSGFGAGGANSPTKPGSGGPGNALAAGGDGAPGSRGGNPDSAGGGTAFGGNGGAGGGNGGIIMIAARTITNNGTIRALGGDGGDGGRGAAGAPGIGGTGPGNGSAGSAGSVVHVKI